MTLKFVKIYWETKKMTKKIKICLLGADWNIFFVLKFRGNLIVWKYVPTCNFQLQRTSANERLIYFVCIFFNFNNSSIENKKHNFFAHLVYLIEIIMKRIKIINTYFLRKNNLVAFVNQKNFHMELCIIKIKFQTHLFHGFQLTKTW